MSHYRNLLAGRIKILEGLNAATDEGREDDRVSWRDHLRGYDEAFRIACDLAGVNFGRAIIDCDLHYIDQGVDRPMCGGEFLTREEGSTT